MTLSSGYKNYMKSDRWFVYRKRQIELADNECQICSNHGCILHIHHLTYDNFMHERDEDTIVVCKNCHKYMDRIRKILKRASDNRNMDKYERMLRICDRYGYPFDMKSNSRKPLKDLWKVLKDIENDNFTRPEKIINGLSKKELSLLSDILKKTTSFS